jgi:hypothetical protein
MSKDSDTGEVITLYLMSKDSDTGEVITLYLQFTLLQ